MEQPIAVLMFVLKSAVALAVGYASIRALRWAARQSPVLGLVLGLGILLRVWAGLALYVISFWNLPVLASLQMGDGFWFLASDARSYFVAAANASGGGAIPVGSPSPSFVETLAWWLRFTGTVPVNAVLLNLVLHVASCVMVIAALRPLDATGRRAAFLVTAALSFSPVLILLSTQPLKDVFSCFLIVMTAVAVVSLVAAARTDLRRWRTVLYVAAIATAIFLMAGVRTYYAMFMWGAVAVALAGSTMVAARPIRFAGFALAVLAMLWFAFMRGAGPYYVMYGNLVTHTLGVRVPFISPGADSLAVVPNAEPGMGAALDSALMLRRGFARSGGGTNLTSDTTVSRLDVIVPVLSGLAAMVVPISLLQQLSIVQFSGGRGFLIVTDLDTLFVDVALVAVVWLLATSGLTRRHMPYLVFSFGLAAITALPMAYIVTNYGTLFRLRLLAILPVLLIPLAFTRLNSMAGDR